MKLGDWSYATYLMHWIVIPIVAKALLLIAPAGGVGPSVIFAVSGVIAANLAGAMVHVFFERPMLRWLHKLGSAFADRDCKLTGSRRNQCNPFDELIGQKEAPHYRREAERECGISKMHSERRMGSADHNSRLDAEQLKARWLAAAFVLYG